MSHADDAAAAKSNRLVVVSCCSGLVVYLFGRGAASCLVLVVQLFYGVVMPFYLYLVLYIPGIFVIGASSLP